MACCALPGGCGRPDCYLCVVMPQKFPQPVHHTEAAAVKNATRDGAPTLAAARTRGHLAFRKRPRAGAFWVPREARR
jgi:hypothetical protein